MKDIIYDGLVGFIFFASLSYISDEFKKKDEYFKIVAFLWAAPFTYFYLLYITSKAGKKATSNFNKHALIGTLATLFLILFYLFVEDMFDINTLILTIFSLTAIFTGLYYYFKLFETI